MSDSTRRGAVAWFARNPVAANLLMLLILLAGLSSAFSLKIEDFPSRPPESISISVSYNSGSAQSAENGVAIKVEEALNGVPGIRQIRSVSSASGSDITVSQISGYDLDLLYQDVKNRIDAITTLPVDAEQPVVSRQLDVEEAMSVYLHGEVDTFILIEAARQLRDKLLASSVVEDVATQGKETAQIVIQVDERALQAQQLTLQDIAQRVADANTINPGGELSSDSGKLVIKADQPRYFQRQFEDILIVHRNNGQQLTLGQLATVSDGFTQTGVLSRFNGQPGIELAVRMYGSGNIMALSEAVNQIVAEHKTSLPQGVQATVWNDSSIYISNRLGLLLDNAVMGIALVMLMLSLLLNVRVAFWVGAGLPVIFAGALLLLGSPLFNLSLNEITTFGFIIALGIVVDDAVVVGESVYTERQRHGANLESTIRGAQRVAIPTVFGVLTTIVAFLSLSLVEGGMGQIFGMFALAASFCLAFSLVESKLILPAHLAHLSPPKPSSHLPGKAWQALQAGISKALEYWTWQLYRPFLQRALTLRYATLMLAVAVFILVLGMVPSGKIKSTFFPDIPENVITVTLTMEQDAGYALTQRQALAIEAIGQQVSRELQQEYQLSEPPIRNLKTQSSEQNATLIAELSPRDKRAFDTNLVADRWSDAIGPLEAVKRLSLTTDHEDEADLSIQLGGADNRSLSAASERVAVEIANFSGVSGVQNSLLAGTAQLDIQLRPEGFAMGLSEAELARQIHSAYQGYEVQRVQRGRDELKVLVRYPDSQRRSIADLEQMRVRPPSGQAVPLGVVATIKTRYVASQIERIDRQRVAVISADLDKQVTDEDSIIEALQSGLFAQLQRDYPGLTIELTGEAEERATTTHSLWFAAGAALLTIYALLAIPLSSYSQPLLIMMAIPFGVIGALLGLWLHGLPLSILAMFGILALSGVVVNDSLLLISRFNDYRQQGIATREAMLNACCSRMRAILLTSITTYVGLVPLILDSSENAQMLIPAAVAMGYGIVFATLITLLLIPALVMIREDLRLKRPAATVEATA